MVEFHRDRSNLRRVLTWKRLLLLCSCTVILFMIIKTPLKNGSSLNDARFEKMSRQWDGATVQHFRRVLDLPMIEERVPGVARNKTKPCKDFWDDDQDYLIITGIPGATATSARSLISHLWLFFNLLALEKMERKSTLTLRLLLPSTSRQLMQTLFKDVQFDDLAEVLNCNANVDAEELLRNARIVGSQNEISFNAARPGNKQLVILNENTRRLKDLSELELSFAPYRPNFREIVLQKVKNLVLRVSGAELKEDEVEAADDDDLVTRQSEEGRAGTISHTFVGIYVKPEEEVG